jgi:DNA processing protein
VVGTRAASAEGLAFARRLAADLAREGVAVLSGGAEGIDTAAHLGALDVGGPTVVVAASGTERPYPQKNAELFRRIVREGGAYVSSVAPDLPALQFRFLQRNQMLAALCPVLVVVEARISGGARHAALSARALGRTVFVVPSAPWLESGAGSADLLMRGFRPLTSAGDALDALGIPRRGSQLELAGPATIAPRPLSPLESEPGSRIPPVPDRKPRSPLDPDAERLLAALERGVDEAEALCAETGLAPGRLQALLLTLTLEGIVVSGPAGRILFTSA